MDNSTIDSSSVGDPVRHRSLAELEQMLSVLCPAPREQGEVTLLVKRGMAGKRECPRQVVLTPAGGMPEDAWGRQSRPNADAQLAVMQADIANLIANGQPLTLFGDNLFLDLDLSADNLPIGSRLKAGEAILEVTPEPHDGCAKFRARFGDHALRLVSKPQLRHRNLRGIYLRVIEQGLVRRGDAVEILWRPQGAEIGKPPAGAGKIIP